MLWKKKRGNEAVEGAQNSSVLCGERKERVKKKAVVVLLKKKEWNYGGVVDWQWRCGLGLQAGESRFRAVFSYYSADGDD
ncbi:hypothetical protein HY992_01780 [Candidatus Micrarchaeota archaeon]|nr:hypothetical protein [Candidatus Micrarchaeota archaeon]